MDKDGRPLGWEPRDEADHFVTCTICGESFDMRDLDQVLDHLHGQEIEEAPTLQ